MDCVCYATVFNICIYSLIFQAIQIAKYEQCNIYIEITNKIFYDNKKKQIGILIYVSIYNTFFNLFIHLYVYSLYNTTVRS